jgi:hypothetical protein
MATTLGCGLRWLAVDQDDAVRRIHEAVGVDAIQFNPVQLIQVSEPDL